MIWETSATVIPVNILYLVTRFLDLHRSAKSASQIQLKYLFSLFRCSDLHQGPGRSLRVTSETRRRGHQLLGLACGSMHFAHASIFCLNYPGCQPHSTNNFKFPPPPDILHRRKVKIWRSKGPLFIKCERYPWHGLRWPSQLVEAFCDNLNHAIFGRVVHLSSCF